MDNRDSRGLSGLTNIGNTCYMNAVLQCLFATDSLNYYITNRKFKKDLKVGIINLVFNNEKHILKLNPHISEEDFLKYVLSKKIYLKEKFKMSMTYGFYQLFTLMWTINCTVKPKQIKELISFYNPKFEGFNQHDSHELLYSIFDRVHDETKNKCKIKKIKVKPELAEYYQQKKKFIKLLNEMDDAMENKEYMINSFNKFVSENYNKDIIIKAVEYWKSYVKENNSIITHTFTGLFSSKITCNNCNNSHFNFEPFNILELTLVDKENKTYSNIIECLQNFCSGEIVSYKCDSCKVENTATKKLNIFRAPKKLIIQLKRFSSQNHSHSSHRGILSFMNMNSGKISDKIDFPLNNLDIKDYTSDIDTQNYVYNLYATVNHSGGLGGGHYVANCKNLLDKKWYHFNDDRISYVDDESEIVDSSAYILFYERD